MIPLRDLNPSGVKPVLTYALIAANIAVFLFQFSLGTAGMHGFVERFGVVPEALVYGGHWGSWVTPVTSMFMHGGFMHLLGNMWFLHIFGDNVEDNLGRARFLAFYVLCGLAAVVAQVAIQPSSDVPMVGASGAIAGVLAGYVTLYPRARVLTLIPIIIFIQFAEIPALFFIFVWFGYQLLMGFTSLGSLGESTGGVAFFAHIGGFVAGLILIRVFRRAKNWDGGFRPPPRSTSQRPPSQRPRSDEGSAPPWGQRGAWDRRSD